MDRLSMAREVLQVRKRQWVADTSTPCLGCEFFELGCTHPSVAGLVTDRVTGGARIEPASAEWARSEEGPCGPEAALYSERGPIGRSMVWLFTKGKLYALGGFLGLLYLISG